MAYVDDLLYSLMKFLGEYDQFTCKDLTGATETVTGTIATLFPDFDVATDELPHIYPLRLFNLEEMPTPCIGIAVEMNDTPQGGFFGGNMYRHTGRFLVIGTKEAVVNGQLTREKDWDPTVRQTMQLQNALTGVFRGQTERGEPKDCLVPWLRAVYNETVAPTVVGSMKIVSWQVVPVDENRFACGFGIEIIE